MRIVHKEMEADWFHQFKLCIISAHVEMWCLQKWQFNKTSYDEIL